MDESKDDFASCFTLSNLIESANKCYKNVKWKNQAQRFMQNCITHCRELQIELFNNTYDVQEAKQFSISERGKTRIIKPVSFRDRVVQRCLCDYYLYDIVEKISILDISACLKDRGTSYASDRIITHLNNTPFNGWILQFDFSNYFKSIDHNLLISFINNLTKDARILNLMNTIINKSKEGLELGSHLNQLLATIYPINLDKSFLKTKGCIGYHRYMDDGIVFYKTKEDALNGLSMLKKYCKDSKLQISDHKTFITKASHPIIFCKLRYKKYNGGVKVSVRKPQTRRLTRHIKSVRKNPKIDIDLVLASAKGYINRGDSDLSRLIE